MTMEPLKFEPIELKFEGQPLKFEPIELKFEPIDLNIKPEPLNFENLPGWKRAAAQDAARVLARNKPQK